MRKVFVYVILIIILSFTSTCYATESLENGSNTVSFETNEPDINSLTIYSDCILMVEKETGDVLYERNAYEKMYPASTTKTLTAIITLENCELDEIVTVSSLALKAVPPSYTTANLQVR